MKFRFVIYIFLSLFSVKILSQNQIIDSLNLVLKTAKGDARLSALIGLSNEFRSKDEQKALQYAIEAKTLAEKDGNLKKGLDAKVTEAKVYLKYGKDKKGLDLLDEVIEASYKINYSDAVVLVYKAKYYYLRDIKSDIKAAISIMDEGIAFATKNNLLAFLGDFYNNRGIGYYYQGDLVAAEKDFLACAAIREKTGDKSELAGTTMNLGVLLYNTGDFKKSIAYYNKALKVFEQLKDTLNIAKCLVNVGMTESDMGNTIAAKEKISHASFLYKAVKAEEDWAGSIENIASILSKEGKRDSALIYYFKVLKVREALKDEKTIGVTLNNIASVYSDLKQYNLALEYIDKAINLEDKIGNLLRKANRLSVKGSIYIEMNNFNEAEKYYLQALKIRQTLNNKKEISASYISLGNLNQKINKPDVALEYYLKALPIKEEMGDLPGVAGITNNIGVIYYDKKEYKKSIEYYEKALALRKQFGDINDIGESYLTLSNSYKEIKDYKNAYDFHVLNSNIKDSLFNNKFTSSISEMQAKYETDKQKQQIGLLEKDKKISEEEIKRKNAQRNGFAIGGFLVLALLFFAVRGYLQKQKDNKVIFEQKKLVELKSAETEAQKNLVEEKQKEIIDSINYAKRLQNAILPANSLINKYLPNNFVFYKPKDIVAGDFYWMYTNEDLVFIAAADSTGHGVPGALVSIVCSNALDKAVKEFGLIDTGKILDKTTDLVLETFDKSGEEIKDGMDISLICFDKRTKKITWSGANNQLLYVFDNQINTIKADKQPIGKSDNRQSFKTHEIPFNSETTFYLMTDGYADQFGGPKGKKFMYKRLEEKLFSISNYDLNKQKEILVQNFNDWKSDLEQLDDVTIIGIRI
jgi:tetratricopeptide (TPR) repeat protein